MEDVGCNVVAGTVGAVDNHLHSAQRQRVRHGALAELDVAAAGIVQAPGLAQAGRVGPPWRLLECRLDGQFPVIGQLLATRGEELDAVVVVAVVRRADDDAKVQAQRPREVGNAWGGQRAAEQNVHASRREASLQGRLQHVAGDARVLADQHRRALGAAPQHLADGVAQPQHEVRGDGALSNGATYAVRAEIGLGHGISTCHCPAPGACSRPRTSGESPAKCVTGPQSGRLHGVPELQCIDRGGDVVNPHDVRTALHGDQGCGDAGCQAVGDRPAGDLPERALA